MKYTKDSILVINNGSSSLKFQIFLANKALSLLAQGKVYDIGKSTKFSAKILLNPEQSFTDDLKNYNHDKAIAYVLKWIEKNILSKITAVVHRIVHGGEEFKHTMIITDQVLDKLKHLSELAPLHQPHNLKAVEYVRKHLKNICEIACFDTAFHSEHSELFKSFALPLDIRAQGIRRYGFHGLSYEWIVHFLASKDKTILKKRIIAAHLGNGSSLCAIKNGKSVDSTMGMTALDGLPMGTRVGAIDPGVLLLLLSKFNVKQAELEKILYEKSGLLGLSQLSNDVGILEKSDKETAKFALEYFCLRTAQYIGMMAVSIGGVDIIAFTGGIGEKSKFVRNKVLGYLKFLRPFTVKVVPANEERMMAMHAIKLLSLKSD